MRAALRILALAGAAATGCYNLGDYTCTLDTNCVSAAKQGICTLATDGKSYCAFSDDARLAQGKIVEMVRKAPLPADPRAPKQPFKEGNMALRGARQALNPLWVQAQWPFFASGPRQSTCVARGVKKLLEANITVARHDL